MGDNSNNTFRTLEADLLETSQEPIHAKVPSGVLWLPGDLDMPRIVTASGVRELRTGHGIIQAFRTGSASLLTFTTTFVTCLYDADPEPIDDDYYTLTDANGTFTVKHEGIYRVSYTNNIDVSTDTSARSGSTSRILINGSVVPAGGISTGYHRQATIGRDSSSQSIIVSLDANTALNCQAARYSGGDTLEFIEGCTFSIERISPKRHPFQGDGS